MKKNLNNTFKTSDTTRPNKKRRRRMGPNISDENLDNEIHALEKRLYYYRARKKGLIKDNEVSCKYKKDQADYAFYAYWTKEHDFVLNYKRLYAKMISSSKQFIRFQTRLREVFNKRATPEQMEKLTALIQETLTDVEKQ